MGNADMTIIITKGRRTRTRVYYFSKWISLMFEGFVHVLGAGLYGVGGVCLGRSFCVSMLTFTTINIDVAFDWLMATTSRRPLDINVDIAFDVDVVIDVVVSKLAVFICLTGLISHSTPIAHTTSPVFIIFLTVSVQLVIDQHLDNVAASCGARNARYESWFATYPNGNFVKRLTSFVYLYVK